MKGTLSRKCLTYSLAYLGFFGGLAFTGNCYAQDKGAEHDSIYRVHQSTNHTSEKLRSLKNLAQLVRQTPDEVQYLQQLLKSANQADSTEYSHWALAALGRYYTNENRLDSLTYWVSYVDSITKDMKEIPSLSFTVHNYLCRYYMINNELETAMNEAVKQQMLAERMDNKMGMVASLENLGLIYFYAERTDLMIPPLEKALDILKDLRAYPNYEVQIIEVLIIGYLKESQFDKAEVLLDRMKVILDSIQNSPNSNFKTFPLQSTWCILYSYRTQLYIATQDKQKAATAAQDAKKQWNESHDMNTRYIYFSSQAYYSYFVKDYSGVFKNLKQTKHDAGSIELMELQINTFRSMGNTKMAMDTYQRLLEVSKNININAYNKQVDQLRSLRGQSEKEKELLKLENQKLTIEQQQTQLLYGIIGVFILLALSGLLLRYILQTRMLKKGLREEKLSLNEINTNLCLAKEKADKARLIKNDFISNMSHEIITPLNAIVGFSELLDKASEDEQAECISMINHNTGILLKHVDEVLKLSPGQSSTPKSND